jgi:O-antigen ligase
MKEGKHILKEKIFYWFLAFVSVTISFPAYNSNSQAIIGFVIFWLFFNSFKEKSTLLKKNLIPFLILSIPFWLVLVGIIFTNDIDVALKEIPKKIPFLVFPLTLLSVKLQNKTIPFITKQFCLGVFFSSLLALLKMIYFKINNLGDYYYYDKIAILLNKHTTYFALFVVLGILFVFYELLNKKKDIIVSLVLLTLFIPMLYMLSVRISVLALLLGGFILLAYHLKTKYVILFLMTLPILFGTIYLTPNFQKRFEKSTIENTEIEDVDYRKLHWKAVLETISKNSLLVGIGTGSNRDYLYNKYKEYKLTAAYEDQYNAHNQFLEITLNYGLIGFLLFLFLLVYLALLFFKSKNSLAASILVVSITFMLTESILERHSGIIVFSLFMSLFFKIYSESDQTKKIIKNQ